MELRISHTHIHPQVDIIADVVFLSVCFVCFAPLFCFFVGLCEDSFFELDDQLS